MVDVVEIVFSPNYNWPSGTDDATISLNARTLYIASESDTSLQYESQHGQAGDAFALASLQLRLVKTTSRLIKHARYR